ncbi:MAG: CYTH domain-containing protein [Acidobacteriota bacterium]
MGVEIERKFLLAGDGWREGAVGTLYRQGYLSTEADRSVRVRIKGNQGFLTIKGRSEGLARLEYEYEIPLDDAGHLLDELCLAPLIEKTRYVIEHAGATWEVDEFAGVNAGLVLAEVELASTEEAVDLPPWIGHEVSDDPRYFNANLVANPYSSW